ncbi:MAG: M48 family metallopeptidase [Candidatus Omnitrophota bacterium]
MEKNMKKDQWRFKTAGNKFLMFSNAQDFLSRFAIFHFSLLALRSTLIITLVAGCATVPIIGRQQLSLIPAGQLVTMSNQSFDQLIKESRISTDQEKSAMSERVGERIAGATEEFLWETGQGYKVRDFDWEFVLIDEPDNINAFAMPGGKIGAYSGIFKVAQSEEDLAAVIAHEVAHVIANHGGERMSQYLLVSLGGLSLDLALQKKEVETRKWWLVAYGLGSTVGYVLPYSRLQEREADRIGLILMAMAGYNPEAAIGLWERMNEQSKSRIPAFLSTHPAPQARIAEIRARIPEAMKYYKKRQ